MRRAITSPMKKMANPLEDVKGFTVGQLAALVHKLGGREAAGAVLENNDLAKQIADLIVGAKKTAIGAFRAMCDYVTPSYKELKASFDWVNEWYERVEFKAIDICKSVSRESRELEFVYVYMGRNASTDDVLAEMEKRNLRPALYEEGLGFAKAHPDEQRKFPIVMFGSVCVDPFGYRNVACLGGDSDGRSLSLDWYGSDWRDSDRFLAVSK